MHDPHKPDPHHAAANMADPHTIIHPPAGAHHVHEAPPMHDAPDEWHDHSHDEKPQRAHGDVQDSNLVLGVGIALFLVITVSVLVVWGFYTHYNTQRSDIREGKFAQMNAGRLAPSPADDTRSEKDADLGQVRSGTSPGKPILIPTEKEGVNATATLAPIDTVIDSIARKYAAGMSQNRK